MCVVGKKKKRESFCIQSKLEVAREKRIYRVA